MYNISYFIGEKETYFKICFKNKVNIWENTLQTVKEVNIIVIKPKKREIKGVASDDTKTYLSKMSFCY